MAISIPRALVPSVAVMLVLTGLPATALATRPDDPLLGAQWALAARSSLGAPRAWEQVTGSPVTVAVIDSGVDVDHPDLRPNMWTNPREVPGNGVDDDGNGFVDDVHGWNFVDDSPDIDDDNGHGTAVAGVVGARGDNRIGISGVAWRSRVMYLKAFDATGSGRDEWLARASDYAVAEGARIINISGSGTTPCPMLQAALARAVAAGALVTVAAGNGDVNLDTTPAYPASYVMPRLIAVAASGRSGGLLAMSNRGAAEVALTAPGSRVLTTVRGGRYGLFSGTSLAAPAVAAALALVASVDRSASPDELEDIVLRTARTQAGPVSAGALDLAAAVRLAHLRARRG